MKTNSIFSIVTGRSERAVDGKLIYPDVRECSMLRKMKCRVVICLFMLCTVLSFESIGQQTEWRSWVSNPNLSIFDVAYKVDSIFVADSLLLDSLDPKAQKFYSRWLDYWWARVDSTGKPSSANKYFADWKSNSAYSCEGIQGGESLNWTLLGPITTPTNSHSARGVGIVRSLYVDPDDENYMLAGSGSGGLWKTTDKGQTWENILDQFGYGNIGVHDLAVHPLNKEHIYLATGVNSSFFSMSRTYGVGILKTEDGGINWHVAYGADPAAEAEELSMAWNVAVDPSDITVAYAAIGNKIIKTESFGDDWEVVLTSGSIDVAFKDIAIHPVNPDHIIVTSIVEKIYMLGQSSNVFADVWKTTNGGDTWTNITEDITQDVDLWSKVFQYEIAESNPNVHYCFLGQSQSVNKIYKSEDNGQSWQITNASYAFGGPSWPAPYAFDYIVSPSNPDVIYFGGVNCRQSLNSGTNIGVITSTAIGANNYVHADHRALLCRTFNGIEYIYSANDGGVNRKPTNTSSSHSWENLSGTGMAIGQIHGIGSGDSEYVLIGLQDLATGRLNFRQGVWTTVSVGDGGTSFVLPENPNIAFANVSNGDIGRSPNAGVSFGGVSGTGAVSTHRWGLTKHSRESTTLWVSTRSSSSGSTVPQVMRSANTGISFQNITPPSIRSHFDKRVILKSAPSNPDVLYIGNSKMIYWGNPTTNSMRLLRLSNATTAYYTNDNDFDFDYTDISAGCEGLIGTTVQDIAIDPFNENRIWVVLGNFRAGEKVYYSGNGGSTWENVSFNLPNMPVNTIEYHYGTNDGLYVGTDVGVFYKDATMQEWVCIMENAPAMMVSDLEINYCRDKLLVGTFGRGLWECDLIEKSAEIEITQNTTYDWIHTTSKVLRIKNGATLTVTTELRVPKDGRIIIEPGGKLVVDGGTITNACGEMWLGIEVWGNHQLSQSPASNQGFLELKNGATVENARCGVRLGHVENYSPWTYDWSKTGGIVRATNAHFRNNSKDVEFLSYANIISGGNEMPNFSFFRDCSFIVDKPLNNGATTLGARVSMWNVNGVRIGRCKFAIEGDALGFYPIQNRGEGIGTIQSGFTVEGTCNYIPQVGSECHPNDITAQSLSETSGDITPCVFRGFRYGIRANGPDGYSNVNIRNSIFEDNFVGVHLMALEQPSLFRNRFYISDQNYTILNNSFPIEHGAILRGCTGYEVKRNFFEGSSSQIDNHLRVGLWIHDSGDEPNEVYLNDFKDLFGGSIAMGWNRNQLIDERGLEILCGLYQNTLYDVAVVQSSEHQGNIAIMQGRAASGPNDVTAPAGNIFNNINYNNGENDYHIDQNSQWIIYQHHNANSTFNVVPWESHIGVDVFLSPNTPEMISRLQACPKNNRGTGHEERSNVVTHQENAEELMEEYEALVDGGDTQGLLDLIASQANESAALRNELLGISPYLSDPVITAAILRNPAMNQWHLCEVLLANSPLRQDVWDAYESAAPLAPVLHDLLEAYQFEGLSARDRLASDIKAELLSKQRALGHYVRIQLGNEDLLNGAEILELMEGEEIKVRLRKEFAHARHAGDASGAAQKLADYEENPETEVWKQVMQVMLSIDAAGGYAGATEAHIEQLTQLAAAGKYGSVHATAMLENITGDIVEEELHFPSPSTKSLKSAKAKGVKPSLAGVYPNPASGEFYITYVLPMERKSASVLIYDAMGRHIATRDITNGHGILSMDARDFSAGTFVFQLQLEGKTVATEKFVIAK